jgi:hypothetical protein
VGNVDRWCEQAWCAMRRLVGCSHQTFASLTVDEVHDCLEGARWREERWRDMLAVVTLHVVAGFGTKKQNDTPWEVKDFLGRDLVQIFPPLPLPPGVEAPEPPDPVLVKLEALEAMGLIRRVQD